ncbi:OTU domain-containing protein 1-like [Ptychodera flava]|uniref:OTU domain-containing protein 1-like n=1 Tax=Ptychodera flava TaxID=63121 RepID=UPI003969D201
MACLMELGIDVSRQSMKTQYQKLKSTQTVIEQEAQDEFLKSQDSEVINVPRTDVTRHGVFMKTLCQRLKGNQTVIQQEAQDEFLESRGLFRYDIIPDGNSLYRAIAESFYGDQSRHDDLKQRAVKYARKNLLQSQHASEGDLELSQEPLGKSSEVNAVSHLLSVHIHVLIGGEDSQKEPKFHIHSPENADTDRNIYISWLSTGHYDAVVSHMNYNKVYMEWLEQQLSCCWSTELQQQKVKDASSQVPSGHLPTSTQGEQDTSGIKDTWEEQSKQQTLMNL